MMGCGENYIAFVWKSMADMLYHCRGLCLKSQINRVRYIMLNNKPKKNQKKNESDQIIWPLDESTKRQTGYPVTLQYFVCVSRVQEWCLSTSSWSVTLRRSFTGPTLHCTAPACLTAATTAASTSTQTPGLHHSEAAVPPMSPLTSPSSSTKLHPSSRFPRGAAAPRQHPLPLDRHQLPATSSNQLLPPPPPPHIHILFTQVPPPPCPGVHISTPTLSHTLTRVGPHPSPCLWRRHPLPCLLHATTHTCEWAPRHARLHMEGKTHLGLGMRVGG